MAPLTSRLRKILEKPPAGGARVGFTRRQKLAIALALATSSVAIQMTFGTVGLWGFDALLVGSLLAGAFLGGAYAAATPVAIVMCYYLPPALFAPPAYPITSLLQIYAVVWSAYIVCGLLGKLLKGRFRISLGFVGEATALGLITAFLWGFIVDTGWWWITYPHTLSWLAVSYLGGLPFTIRRILSTLLLTPALSLPLLVVCQRIAIKVPVKVEIVAVAKERGKAGRLSS